MNSSIPLAERMRPMRIDDYIGQSHLLKKGKPLSYAITQKNCHSMILWGPPGVGKTTLAKLLAKNADARVETISAVLAGVRDIRAIVERAKEAQEEGVATVLFVDEVHRFNKSQQDAFLPHVEAGIITLIGATTENPSFALNNALLSRLRVYVLKTLTQQELLSLLDLALSKDHGLKSQQLAISDEDKKRLVQYADGDARSLLNMLEVLADFVDHGEVNSEVVDTVVSTSLRRFDHKGDQFYDQISALHKSVRGSDPNAALYWFARMVDGGCDPRYLARRLVRMAYEDIGLADPRACEMALNAANTYERLGSPEGELALANVVIYLSTCAKSNAAYMAYNAAQKAVQQYGSKEVPLSLRNAPTSLMKQLDYGKGYRYAHDEKDAFAAGASYFPEGMPEFEFYQPVERGLEIKLKQKLELLKSKNQKARQ